MSTALRWAAEKNVRIVIKSTGHNFPGRNTGYGSLSIWTHNLRGIEYLNNFKPTSCPMNGTLQAIRVGAGETGIDVEIEAAKHNAVVVSGANPVSIRLPTHYSQQD